MSSRRSTDSHISHALVIAPGKVARILFGVVALLLLASIPAPLFRYVLGHDYVHGFVPFAEHMFSLNSEASIPAWFSSTALLLCSFALAAIGYVRRAEGAAYARHWIALAGIFLFFSVDEAATLHEQTNEPLQQLVGADGIFYYSWVVLGAAVVLIVGIAYLGFLRALPASTRNWFLAAAFLYVGGALGLEFVGGFYADSLGSVYSSSGLQVVLTHIEEVMEMAGTVTFLYALLAYLRSQLGVLRVSFESP